MKQLIILIILVGGGYYLYTHGFLNVFNKLKLSPKEFVSDVKSAASSAVGARALPDKVEERACSAGIPRSYMGSLEQAVFSAYDSRAAYALVEMSYLSGLTDTERLITRYINTFTTAEEKNRILNMVSKYQDKETFNLLNRFFQRGTFNRRNLLRKMAEYKTNDAATVIQLALEDKNAGVRAEAEALSEQYRDEPWFSEGKKMQLSHRHLEELMDTSLVDI